MPEARYANLINYRVTARELVLEFGSFFPGQEGRIEADSQRDMDVRVVISADLIELFVDALEAAKRQRDAERAAVVGRLEQANGGVRQS